jgi:hypothetical protein
MGQAPPAKSTASRGPAVTEDDIAATAAEAGRYDSVMVDGKVVSSVHSSPQFRAGAPPSDIYIEVDLAAGAISNESVPGMRRQASTAPLSSGYLSVGEVLRCKYVLSQLFFNMVGSFVGPVFCFWIIFGVLSSGPYPWDDAAVIGPIIGSPFVSATLCPFLAPLGLPEAKKWGLGFGKVNPKEVQRWACLFPFLGRNPIWRHTVLRHLMMGLEVGIVMWPIAILLARYAVGPVLNTWTQILSGAVYCVVLAAPNTLLGMLSLSIEPHLARAESGLSYHPNTVLRLLKRFWWCVLLQW